MNSGLQFYEGITTREIQSILVKSAHDLISTESPNYQFVAARLLLFAIQKQVFNTKWKDSEIYPPLKEIVERNIEQGVYDASILDAYTDEEFDKINSYIKHSRDLNFTYAGLQQIVDKYLVQDRSSGDVYETPQFMYMLIAMTLFQNYDKEVRLDYVKRYYDPTYQVSKLTYQHQSWQELELHSDNLHLAFSLTPMIHYQVSSQVTMQSESMLHNEGIGINLGSIRGIGSKIRG